MKVKVSIIIICISVICSFAVKSMSADKVVVIPLMKGAKAGGSIVEVAEATRYVSIPGAGFLPMDAFNPIRRSITTTPNGSIYHPTQSVTQSFIAPLNFPHGAKSFTQLSAAICSPLTNDVTVSLFERSMIDGTLTERLTYTLDNALGTANCHVLFGNSGMLFKQPIDTESNVYFITATGLLGQGEFFFGAELDYVRVAYQIDEITVTN